MPVTASFDSAWNGYGPLSPAAGVYSLMMFLVNELRSTGDWCSGSSRVSGVKPFAFAQATTHDLHPTHRVASYSMPTASRGAEGSSTATAVPVSAAEAPPAIPILINWRRVIDIRCLRRLRSTSRARPAPTPLAAPAD